MNKSESFGLSLNIYSWLPLCSHGNREELKTEYDHRLQHELDALRHRTNIELDQLKSQTRDMYERENRFCAPSQLKERARERGNYVWVWPQGIEGG